MFEGQEFLAIDWGTTNRRVYRLGSDGQVQDTCRDDRGVVAVQGKSFDAEMHAIRERMGDLPAVCAGMIGSDRGWVATPYVPAPCTGADIAAQVTWVEPARTAILPGVAVLTPERSDVMRGEEVQLLGAPMGGYASDDALLCQPGTHCKWAQVTDGRIVDFHTSMTGELFALLVGKSLLSDLGNGQAQANADFVAGVERSAEPDILTQIFGIRADRVSGRRTIADPHSYLSGLIIGRDVRDALKGKGSEIFVLAGPELGELYLSAISTVGSTATLLDSHACFAAGIQHIVRHL